MDTQNNLVNKLIENYEKNPEKICLIQNEEKISYKDLYNKVLNYKEYFEKEGIKEKQKILVLVTMSAELYYCLLAIWSIGAIPCFMDAGFIKNNINKNDFENIEGIIENSKYILYSNINNNLKKLKIKININKIKILENKNKLNIKKVEEEYPAIMTYTSGTTGKPKIAVRTHKFLNTQGEILKNAINYESTDIEVSTMPIFTLSNINARNNYYNCKCRFFKFRKIRCQKNNNSIK